MSPILSNFFSTVPRSFSRVKVTSHAGAAQMLLYREHPRANSCSPPLRTTSSGNLTGWQGSILSPNATDYDYRCSWNINTPAGTIIKLSFEELNIYYYSMLDIYDGESLDAPYLGRFSGSIVPPPILSTGNSLYIRYYNPSYTQLPFKITYEECGRVPTGGKSRVVGGSLANVGKWPWQASLQYYNSHMCGASLISKDWLVSAAHCFEGRNDVNAWQVRLGTTYIYDSWSSVNLAVAEIITHERFNYTAIDYDIALVRLSWSVDFTSQISPICLPPDTSHFPLPGKTCYISGWGRTSEADYGVYYELLDAPMDVFSHSGCSSDKMNGKSITTRMICIGHPAGGISACQGDSGGPLTCQGTDGTWYLSGVTSWGNGCARPMKPAVYTKTSKLLKWIKQYTGL
ncbi:prostasin-like [Lampetra fluviatilis]